MKKQSKNPQKQTGKKRKISVKRVLIVCTVIIAMVVVGVGAYFGVTVHSQIKDVTKEDLINASNSVLISTKTNEEYYTCGKNGVRKNVSYEDIPQVMIDAVVAAEDSRYFEHNGFDLPRIVKAFLGNITAGGITGGGSTITQQVIKNSVYPNAESENLIQGLQRKMGEIVLSMRTTSDTTKEEVLELYLNKIYFGYGNKAIGIYAASRYYFDKNVQNLTLPEAALLAGTLNSPNRFDPFRNLKYAQQRRDTILDLMQLHGYITEEECEKTKAIPVENTLKSNPLNAGGKYQAYVDMVLREVSEKSDYDPETTPMRIYTYLDPDVQSKLDDIANGKSYSFIDKDVDTGACIQETKTGHITAVLSKRNYTAGDATNAYAKKGVKSGGYGQPHQPGSSLKPIIAYAAAFEYLDYSTAHYVHDVPLSGSYSPKNYDNKFHGDVSIKEALSNSWNLAAIQTYLEVMDEIDEQKMVDYLSGFGIDMSNETLKTGYAIGGWDYGVTPKEEASAYATIANGGTYIEPHTVDRIEIIATGEVINFDDEAQQSKSRALSEESAFMIRSVMTDYVKSSSNYSRLNLGLQIGAKTGTSNWANDSSIPSALRGRSKDSWLSAFSPDYAWSVWVGFPDNIARKKGKAMHGSDAKNIAGMIAKYLHNGKVQNSYLPQPSGVVKGTCVTGIYPYIKPGSNVPKERIISGFFKKGNTPSGSASASSIPNLESFNAVLTSDNKIQVEFPQLNQSKSGTPTKTYKANGKSYTLPYLGDINQIYGSFSYGVEVVDSSGKVVHSEILESENGILSFTPQSGDYIVRGFYTSASGESTSNKIEKTVSVKARLGASYSVSGKTDSTITLNMTVPAGNTVVVTITSESGNSSTQKMTSSGRVTFSSLTPGINYTITFVETTSDGQQRQLQPYYYKIESQEETNIE